MSSSPTSSSSSPAAPEAPFPALLDLECPIDMVLGSGRLTVGACLTLEPKQVIRLDAPAGTDLQVVMGGVPLMRGEVVLVGESAAIRITEIVPAPGVEG